MRGRFDYDVRCLHANVGALAGVERAVDARRGTVRQIQDEDRALADITAFISRSNRKAVVPDFSDLVDIDMQLAEQHLVIDLEYLIAVRSGVNLDAMAVGVRQSWFGVGRERARDGDDDGKPTRFHGRFNRD